MNIKKAQSSDHMHKKKKKKKGQSFLDAGSENKCVTLFYQTRPYHVCFYEIEFGYTLSLRA